MRAKFGGSAGLNSSGKNGHMQGIGSSVSGDDSGSDVLGDTSKLAYSLVSSVWETTSKVVGTTAKVDASPEDIYLFSMF